MTSYFLSSGKIPLSVPLCPRNVTSCVKNYNFLGCNLRLNFLIFSKTSVKFLSICFSEQLDY